MATGSISTTVVPSIAERDESNNVVIKIKRVIDEDVE